MTNGLQSQPAEARELLSQGNISEAAQVLDEALRRDPKNAETRFLLGVAHFKSGEWFSAEGDFRDAIALNDRHILANAHYYLGLALERQGRPDDARLEYQQVLRNQPGHEVAELVKKKLGIDEAPIELSSRRQPQHEEEQPVPGRREEAPLYRGELLFSGNRRMRSFSDLFLLACAALVLTIVLHVFAIAAFLLLFAILALNSRTTKYEIYERMMDFKTGVFNRLEHSVWTYQIDDVLWKQTPFNQLTGDATIQIHTNISGHSQVSQITGLGNHKFMNQLFKELRDAALVERRAMKRWWI
jgi:tetratricopeptide (TPR) repeat protein